MSDDTPAIVVYRVSWPDQKVIKCTVGELVRSVKEEKIFKDAVIIVGKVANLKRL